MLKVREHFAKLPFLHKKQHHQNERTNLISHEPEKQTTYPIYRRTARTLSHTQAF